MQILNICTKKGDKEFLHRRTSKDECHSFTRTWTVHWECQQDRSLCQWRQENNSTWQNTNSSLWLSSM